MVNGQLPMVNAIPLTINDLQFTINHFYGVGVAQGGGGVNMIV